MLYTHYTEELLGLQEVKGKRQINDVFQKKGI